MKSVIELENSIIKYANLYYQGKDTISDAEFDDLVDQLRSIDPDNIILKTTGWGSDVPNDRKIPHPIVNVGGLGKIKCDPETILKYKSATPKYDGASVELIYNNGQLVTAITRGNGAYGQNVTDHLIPIVGTNFDVSGLDEYIAELVLTSMISISGEFILSKESFKKNYPNEITYRNIPSGFLNRNSVTPEECRKFSFIPYRINAIITDIDNSEYYDLFTNRRSIQDTLNYLFGLYVPYSDGEYNEISYIDMINMYSSKSDYNFDGIVVNNTDNIKYSIEKVNNRIKVIYHYDEIAYKIVTETEDVIVNNISWNLTRTGRYIPVVEFDPVQLSGAMVRRATGHNAKTILDHKIKIGSLIRITRAGEIIPSILGVFDDGGEYHRVSKS